MLVIIFHQSHPCHYPQSSKWGKRLIFRMWRAVVHLLPDSPPVSPAITASCLAVFQKFYLLRCSDKKGIFENMRWDLGIGVGTAL